MSQKILDDYLMKFIEGELKPIGFPMVDGIKQTPHRSEVEELAALIDGHLFAGNKILRTYVHSILFRSLCEGFGLHPRTHVRGITLAK